MSQVQYWILLSDGIYPRWATIVKTIPLPQGAKAKLFAKRQEGHEESIWGSSSSLCHHP